MPVSARPRVTVEHRRVYASVDVDLWPCAYNLTGQGQERCHELLLEAAQRTHELHPGCRPIYFCAGPSIVSASRVDRGLADELAGSVVAIVSDPAYQEPVRL